MTYLSRCAWLTADPLYQAYHDNEWGRPCYDAKNLFAQLMLEGQQAGLSWLTVLRKRESYRKVFANFDPSVIAQYDEHHVAKLVQNPDIIRHRKKIEAIIHNAGCWVREEQSGRDWVEYLWRYAPDKKNRDIRLSDIPTQTTESVALSHALKLDGFRYVGPTICYAFMQAVGMVNDHDQQCFKYVCHAPEYV